MDNKGKIIYPDLSYEIVGCLFEVFNKLGPNHREKYYQKAIADELKRHNIKFKEQYPIKITYKDLVLGKNFLDFVIDDKIVLEIKTGIFVRKEYFEQILSYLKVSGLRSHYVTR